MHHTEEDDEFSGIYGRFFAEDGQARSEAPIPISKLVQLFRTSDPRLRSKVARMVGRYSQYQSFVARRLQEDDPRVRANAIESLWGVDTDVARRFLETAISDTHHRARVNAIYGLYLLGNPASVRLLVKQAKHNSASFRTAALWAVGQTADPRFLQLAKDSSGDPDESVRRVAALAITRIEERVAAEQSKPIFRTRILRAKGPDPDWRTMRVLLPKDISGTVKPTDFIIEENGHIVHSYEVDHVTTRSPLRIGIALPEAKASSTWVSEAEASLRTWLAAPQRKDSFAIFRYAAGERKPTYTAKGLRAIYATRPEIVAEQLAMQVPAGDLGEGLQELVSGLFGLDAERAIVIFAEVDLSSQESAWCSLPAEVMANLQSSKVPLHVVTTAASGGSAVETSCAILGGLVEASPSADALRVSCATIFNSFSDRFEIRYLSDRHAGPGSTVKLIIQAPGGRSEEAATLV